MDIKVIHRPNLKRNFSFTRTELQSISDQAVKGIKSRTNRGLDVKNIPFKPYSKGYKKKGKVNLKVTGKMVNAIDTKINSNKIVLRATDPKAKYHQYQGAGRGKTIRRWFGIDIRLEKRLIKSFRVFWKKKVEGKK